MVSIILLVLKDVKVHSNVTPATQGLYHTKLGRGVMKSVEFRVQSDSQNVWGNKLC